MLVRIPYLVFIENGIPQKSIRGYEPHTDFVFVDRRRFARSYRKWRSLYTCDFYVKRFERLAGFRGKRKEAA